MPGFSQLVDVMRLFFDWIFHTMQGLGLPNYGVAILVLTIIIRTALQPLSIKQAKSMRAMQAIQPKMKEVQEKYKSDPQEMNKQLGQLYKDHKVNPLMGCLPMLVQMPFLFAMFYVLRDYNYDPHFVRFLWLPTLHQPDPLYIMPVLVGLTTFIQMKLSSTTSTNDQMQLQMKIMTTIMPVFIGYVSMNFASGLSLYWVFGNIYSIIYQFYFNRKTAKLEMALGDAEDKHDMEKRIDTLEKKTVTVKKKKEVKKK